MIMKQFAAVLILLFGVYTMMFGQHNVHDDGSFGYTVPITLPGGEDLLKPTLGFVYNSNVPNGELGLGWMLSGLSSIELDQNSLGYEDYFGDFSYKLDGQKLIETGTNEYKTEILNYSTIKSTLDLVSNITDQVTYDQFMQDENGMYIKSWQVTDTRGTKYIYGELFFGRNSHSCLYGKKAKWC